MKRKTIIIKTIIIIAVVAVVAVSNYFFGSTITGIATCVIGIVFYAVNFKKLRDNVFHDYKIENKNNPETKS